MVDEWGWGARMGLGQCKGEVGGLRKSRCMREVGLGLARYKGWCKGWGWGGASGGLGWYKERAFKWCRGWCKGWDWGGTGGDAWGGARGGVRGGA